MWQIFPIVIFLPFAAYYGSTSFGPSNAAGMGSHAEYASYYNNYMAAAAGSFYGTSGKATSGLDEL